MLERFAVAFTDDATYESVKTALRLVAIKHPDLEKSARSAAISRDAQKIERAFETAIGMLIAQAQAGTIKMNPSTLKTLRTVRFDHMHGTYSVGGGPVSALTLIAAPAERTSAEP